MSVSKHSTWNRTTILGRAYRGRSRCCHHPLNLRDYRFISTTISAAGVRSSSKLMSYRAAELRGHCLPAKGTPLPTVAKYSCRRADGRARLHVPLVLWRGCVRPAIVLRIHAPSSAPRPLHCYAPGPARRPRHPLRQDIAAGLSFSIHRFLFFSRRASTRETFCRSGNSAVRHLNQLMAVMTFQPGPTLMRQPNRPLPKPG